MLTGILWIVIGVLLYALYSCVMAIREQQRTIRYLEHRLDSILEWSESIGREYNGE